MNLSTLVTRPETLLTMGLTDHLYSLSIRHLADENVTTTPPAHHVFKAMRNVETAVVTVAIL